MPAPAATPTVRATPENIVKAESCIDTAKAISFQFDGTIGFLRRDTLILVGASTEIEIPLEMDEGAGRARVVGFSPDSRYVILEL